MKNSLPIIEKHLRNSSLVPKRPVGRFAPTTGRCQKSTCKGVIYHVWFKGEENEQPKQQVCYTCGDVTKTPD